VERGNDNETVDGLIELGFCSVLSLKWLEGLFMSIDQLMAEALALPNNLKIQLVEELLASLETTDEAIQAEWIVEAQRRRDEILSGTVQIIPGDEALAQVRNLLSQ
jgi:hypothetical protein